MSSEGIREKVSKVSQNDIVYKRMGDLEVGDELLSSDGGSSAITDAYEEHIPEEMYRLSFKNGEEIEASGNHLWYTISSLDRQLYRERLKNAKVIVKRLTETDLGWLRRFADMSTEDSPAVDASFIFEALRVQEDDDVYTAQILRALESIGPVAMRSEYIYDETVESLVEVGSEGRRLYSLKLFCEQLLALYSKVSRSRYRTPYDLLMGKVRTTAEIAATWDMKHDFPSVRMRR